MLGKCWYDECNLYERAESYFYPTMSSLQRKKSPDSMNGVSVEGQIGLTLQRRTEIPKKHLTAHSLKYLELKLR